MEAYPPQYVQHNLPFIVLSGLGTTKELDPPPPVHNVLPGRAVTTISSDIPAVTGDRADTLLQDFLSADTTNAPWNGRSSGRKSLASGFRIRAVGRVGQASPQCDRKGDLLTLSRTSSCHQRKLMHPPRPLRPLQVARLSLQLPRGSCTRPYLRSPPQPPSFPTASLRLPG
jgi:hypothetical protein